MDPLHALQAAYAVPADSKEQADLLAGLREHLEGNPSFIPVLCSNLVRGVSGAADSLLKNWTLDLLHFGLCKANLSIEKRTELATSSLDVLSNLLNDPSVLTIKAVIQCFGSVYPLLFRYLCTNRALRPMWDTLSACKAKILEMVWQPTASAGLKLAALKFMQRVILVQTRGISDPRLQKPTDPNLAFCPPDHPFIPVAALEAEGTKLIEGVLTIFYTNPNPDMMGAVVNSWSVLAKQRPAQSALIINALASWSPGAISHFPASAVKGVEKAVRILLIHLSRTPQAAPHVQLISDALSQQTVRMEQAAINERNRKAAAEAEANHKRSINALRDGAGEAKRQKVDHGSSSLSGVLANFDFSSLPATLITDIIVQNLQLFSEERLAAAVLAYRRSNGLVPLEPEPAAASTSAKEAPIQTEQPIVKAEPLDPLQMDIDEDEVDYEPEKINAQMAANNEIPPDLPEGLELIDVEEALRLADFKIPSPDLASDEERQILVKSSMSRIWNSSGELLPVNDGLIISSMRGSSPQDLWMLLLVRMITRVDGQEEGEDGHGDGDDSKGKGPVKSTDSTKSSRDEKIRHVLFDYIMTDFPSRERLASIWMNEEWYNDQRLVATEPTPVSNYDVWLQKILTVYEPLIDGKDRTLSQFLADIPHIPPEALDILRELCLEQDRLTIGLNTLRDFAITRVPLRPQAMKILLDLTTHPEKATRATAIITVKKYLLNIQPTSEMVRTFALRLIRRLQQKKSLSPTAVSKDADGMEDGEMEQEEDVQTEYLPARLEIPAEKNQVLQHVELIFSLSSKLPEFLDEIFDAYGQMDDSVQVAIQDLITALIRSLGPNNQRLLALLRSFPPGAETLALRILNIFTQNARPSPHIVTLVKTLVAERDLDARFLIPIIAEMDKSDIVKLLPKIVSMLDGTTETKQLIKNVFESVVTAPPQTFGSVSSNLPRVRQSELLTPAELMVLLHESEKEIGLKAAIEAIGICFSMTDVFRSEVLAVVMQQIVDEPVMPVLFLRTVIQAVSTYKSLVAFVATTLLSRLITKKIWTNPPLWEGFMRCAKAIAPVSYGALLQLPKEQLRELVEKQPGLKAGLRDHVLKKAGNKARQAGFLDIFGDERSESPAPQPQVAEIPSEPA